MTVSHSSIVGGNHGGKRDGSGRPKLTGSAWTLALRGNDIERQELLLLLPGDTEERFRGILEWARKEYNPIHYDIQPHHQQVICLAYKSDEMRITQDRGEVTCKICLMKLE